MELVCVRHGRTAWNAERRFQGQSDIPLDDEGRAQALALAAHLGGERFDRAVTSDLVRARATAEAICAGRDLALQSDASLREMHFGVWEGLTWPEIVDRWPELAENYEYSPRTYVPEDGEGWENLYDRVDAALRRFAAGVPPAGRALIVSHAGVMHAILAIARGERDAGDESVSIRVKLAHAGIVRVRGSFAEGWTVTAINETAPPLGVTA